MKKAARVSTSMKVFSVSLFIAFDFCQDIGHIQISEPVLLTPISMMYFSLEHSSCGWKMFSHHTLSMLTEFSNCYHISCNPWRAGGGFLSLITHSFADFSLASVPPLVGKRIK